MKTKKLNLEDFKENQLESKQLMTFKGGDFFNGQEGTWVYYSATDTWDFVPTTNLISLTEGTETGTGSSNGDVKIKIIVP